MERERGGLYAYESEAVNCSFGNCSGIYAEFCDNARFNRSYESYGHKKEYDRHRGRHGRHGEYQ